MIKFKTTITTTINNNNNSNNKAAKKFIWVFHKHNLRNMYQTKLLITHAYYPHNVRVEKVNIF